MSSLQVDTTIRKFNKKARKAERMYNETGDTKYLNERDNHMGKVASISKNKNKNKNKNNNDDKTEDQLINEAIKENRRFKIENEKNMKEQLNKENENEDNKRTIRETILANKLKQQNEMAELKMREIEMDREFLEQKDLFINKYIQDNPESNHSIAHKAFIIDYKNKKNTEYFKIKVLNDLNERGSNEEDSYTVLEEIMGQRKEFINQSLNGNPKMKEEDLSINFLEKYTDYIKMLDIRSQIINHMVSEGMTVEEAQKKYDILLGQMDGENIPCEGCDDCGDCGVKNITGL